MPFEDDPSYENDFSNVMKEAADATEPPAVELMAAGAAQRGRRVKRRRTVLAVAASVVVLAGAGTLLSQLHLGRHSSTAVSAAAASRPAASSPSASTSTAVSTKGKQVTDDQMLALLKERLSAVGGQLVSPMSHGTEPGGSGHFVVPTAMAAYTIIDGNGPGAVSVQVTRTPANFVPGKGCSADRPKCSETTLPDGSDLVTILPETPDTPPGLPKNTEVWLYSTNGIMVFAESGNIPGPGQGTTLGKGPKLTPDQLKTLAEDPVWLQVGEALPAK